MENYHRDSLREMRKETQQPHKPHRGNRWLTFFIILLFLFAGGFFLATQGWLKPENAKDVISKWSHHWDLVFKKEEENDITKTVDAVLAQQNEAV